MATVIVMAAARPRAARGAVKSKREEVGWAWVFVRLDALFHYGCKAKTLHVRVNALCNVGGVMERTDWAQVYGRSHRPVWIGCVHSEAKYKHTQTAVDPRLRAG